MAYSPIYHSNAPYHGVAGGQAAHRDLCHPSIPASFPDVPYCCADVVPPYFVSSPTPITPSRGMRSISQRVRRSRAPPDHRAWSQDVATLQEQSAAGHATCQPRSSGPVYFVPDPPAWASPGRDEPALEAPKEYPAGSRHQAYAIDGDRLPVDCHRSSHPSTRAPQYCSSPGATMGDIPPSPPATPRIPRLRTPDIKPVDDCRPFCHCHRHIGPGVDSRWKMDMQCKSGCPHRSIG